VGLVDENLKAKRYDHQKKAGNKGDIVKHPALVAALNGLLAEHADVFRYADTFAGRWQNQLKESAAWKPGIKKFSALWTGGNADVQFWHDRWVASADCSYPGSTNLAKQILGSYGNFEIRAFESVEDYATSLRSELGNEAVFVRSTSAGDFSDWIPDLLFIDPPGLINTANPDYPNLESLLSTAEEAANALIWLPMISDPNKGGPIAPLNANTVESWSVCVERGFQVIGVRWHAGGPTAGCLIAYRFHSSSVAERIATAVSSVAKTMGENWRFFRGLHNRSTSDHFLATHNPANRTYTDQSCCDTD